MNPSEQAPTTHPAATAEHTPEAVLALRTNAAFSLATGIAFAVAPATLGGWLGVSIDGWLRLFGLGLLGHGVALGWASASATPKRWIPVNLAMIAPYPFAVIGLIVAGVIDGDPGRLLAVIDAAVIAAVTGLHLRAMGWFTNPRRPAAAALSN
jgi:hypothetical protein